MKRVVIVQARMGSTRLPGKVLMDVAGQPMLSQQIKRLKQCKAVDEIVVATTNQSADHAIVEVAKADGVNYFCGSEDDVLSRFVGAARQSQAEVVVRVTADCPLIDPEITDKVINELVDHKDSCDYASNVLERTYPRGLDVECLFWDTLLRIERLAESLASREHVTTVVYAERPELFLRRSLKDVENNSDLRWTVDTEKDLDLVRTLYESLGIGERCVSFREILQYVRARPELAAMNAGIETWDPVAKEIATIVTQ